MQLVRAVLYCLFASTARPGQALRLRTVFFTVCLLLFGWLSLQIAPTFSSMLGGSNAGALLYVVTCFFVNLLYALSDAAHISFMGRLRLVYYMPLKPRIVRLIQAITYIPVTLVGAALILPILYHMAAFLGEGLAVGVILIIFIFASAHQIIVRTAQGWLGKSAQAAGLVWAVVALGVCWQSVRDSDALQWQVMTWVMAGLQLFFTAYALRCGPRTPSVAQSISRIQWERPGAIGSYAVRAFRTRRYCGANITLFVLFSGFVGLTVWNSHAVPFDAVAVIGLLLCGTLGQEARAVSRAAYPIELVLYGQLGTWLRGIWLLALADAVFFIEVVLLTAIVLIPSGIQATYGQVVGTGVGMIAVGIAAGSLIVSARNDILAQLASTAIYGATTYAVLKIIAANPGKEGYIASLLVLCSLAISYAAERIRWLRRVRGIYAFIR